MFKTESDLISAFLDSNYLVPEFKDLDIIYEFPYHNGRTDIVLVEKNEEELQKRLHSRLNTPLSKIIHVKILYHFNQHTFLSSQEICKLVSGTNISSIINFLVKLGYLVRNDHETYSLSYEYKSHINKAIAIEGKLKDWKAALTQVKRSCSFATHRFVLLAHENSTGAISNLNYFIKHNIGLILMEENRFPICIHNPKELKPYSWIYSMFLNEYHLSTLRGEVDVSS